MKNEVEYEKGTPVCPDCKSSVNLEYPEDRYDRKLIARCKKCDWNGYCYDES